MPERSMSSQEIQLTHAPTGHCLNSTQSFSPDDAWIVFDGRNHDGDLAENGRIALVSTRNGEVRELYQAPHQQAWGPGVGAATFSPVADTVLFLHGLRNASSGKPYAFTRRTGVAVNIPEPGVPHFLDARNIHPPFTPGALRGGTHAHTWSGDGRWISFTYNDAVLEEAARINPALEDLRTVGVMNRSAPVQVPSDPLGECHSGEYFACLVAEVTSNPVPGSDEIDRAFDETWIGRDGYRQADGRWLQRAIAFQGQLRNPKGQHHTEIFVVDLPEDITQSGQVPLEGSLTERPGVPMGTVQRRITFSEHGVQGPRHWLRTTADGELIAFLSLDGHGVVQLFGVSPVGGAIRQLTHLPFPVEGPFNIHGTQVAYIADQRVWVTDIHTGSSFPLTQTFPEGQQPVGAPAWSNNGKLLAYNRRIPGPGGNFLQIFLVEV